MADPCIALSIGRYDFCRAAYVYRDVAAGDDTTRYAGIVNRRISDCGIAFTGTDIGCSGKRQIAGSDRNIAAGGILGRALVAAIADLGVHPVVAGS